MLDWGFTHVDDSAFLRRSPSEVALYLLARRSALATVVRLGTLAPAHLDYRPELDPNRVTPEQLAVELVVGFIPGVGEVVFALEATTGISLTGRQLDDEERIVTAFCVLVPFAGLASAGESLPGLERMALLTGHSLEEVQVLSRVASRFSPSEVEDVERILRGVSSGRRVTAEELERLNQIAHGMEQPLLALADAVRKGGSGLSLGARLGADGAPLAAARRQHLADCWVQYQFRNPERFRRFSFSVDPTWERLYRSILENSASGGEFEEAVLQAKGYQKNSALMMPPPGSALEGFVPDAVAGNPGELVWGKPYNFVEVKGRQEMALTGNLKAMLEYVKEYGGHVEAWFRSGKRPLGNPADQPLQERLERLKGAGKATTRYFP